MSVSAMDMAKLPSRHHASDVAPDTMTPAPGAGRRALREERRQMRRQQRRYAAAGIAVLATVFLVAVIVLGGIR